MFEPDSDAFRDLQLRHAGDPSVYIFEDGLWREEGTIDLYLTRKRECSSVYKPNISLIESLRDSHHNQDIGRFNIDKELKIDVVRLDSALDKVVDDLIAKGHPKDSITVDKIKIDTQGSEFDILQGMGKYIDLVEEIEVEVEFVELYLGQKLFSDIDSFLTSKGFVLDGWVRKVKFSGIDVFGDAVYKRRS